MNINKKKIRSFRLQFESQDVLVPWPKAYCMNSVTNRSKRSSAPHATELYYNQNAQKFPSSKRYLIDSTIQRG